jgi:hypothetical protein
MDTGTSNSKTTTPTLHRLKNFIVGFAHYIVLSFLFILLAGHENINPQLGNSHVDFYLKECKHLLEIHSKASLIHSDKNDYSLNNRLEQLSRAFYIKRQYSPAWTLNYRSTPQLDQLIALIDSATYFGIPSNQFSAGMIRELVSDMESNAFTETKPGIRVNLEMIATQQAFKLMVLLNCGIFSVDTSEAFMEYTNTLPALVTKALSADSLSMYITNQQPTSPVYTNIINAIPAFIHTEKAIASAESGIATEDLARAFFYAGILKVPAFDSVNSIGMALEKFQRKHNLKVTNVLNSEVVATLSSDLKMKSQLISLNLDRIRKTKINGGNYLFVNIPEFVLNVYHNNKLSGNHKVVVGKRQTPTPIFSSRLEKIITNPYWTVPKSIVQNEMLHKIREDSSFLEDRSYFVINWKEQKVEFSEIDWNIEDPLGRSYWIRQNNGNGNALGKVKFLFPNKHRVFLHDTPSKRLFKREKRAFSHGCIRVQNPNELAQFLSDKYYATSNDSVSIDNSIAKRKREVFEIKEHVEIHIQYITCTTNENSELVFLNDLYKKDSKELKNLGI